MTIPTPFTVRAHTHCLGPCHGCPDVVTIVDSSQTTQCIGGVPERVSFRTGCRLSGSPSRGCLTQLGAGPLPTAPDAVQRCCCCTHPWSEATQQKSWLCLATVSAVCVVKRLQQACCSQSAGNETSFFCALHAAPTICGAEPRQCVHRPRLSPRNTDVTVPSMSCLDRARMHGNGSRYAAAVCGQSQSSPMTRALPGLSSANMEEAGG